MPASPTRLSRENLALLNPNVFAPVNPVNPFIQAAFGYINDDRGRNGSPPVQLSPELSRVAQAYAEFLMRTNTFAHVDPYGHNPEDRARNMGVMVPVAENLALEESSFEDPSILVRRAEAGMMAEPPNQINHRFNILNPRHHYVGVGVARVGGKIILVQEFSERAP